MHNTPSQLKTVPYLLGLLLLANLGIWAWAYVSLASHPVLMGMAVLAYTFGLRHGVDADHIAAIDNVTRNLMGQGRRSWDAGLFFSLGHSTIVVVLCVSVAALATVASEVEGMKEMVGWIGSTVSAAFLLLIGISNIGVLRQSWSSFASLKLGRIPAPHGHAHLGLVSGPLGHLFGRFFRLIGKGWHMYPLGLLFGLGFDTATEIGLLGISAGQAESMSGWSILIFPALFTAGMSLVDTADSVLMAGAYRWSMLRPARKLFYALTINSLSVAMALGLGAVEVLGMVGDRFRLEGGLWSALGAINENFELIGFGMVGLFLTCWAISAAWYRLGGFDRLDAQPQMPAE